MSNFFGGALYASERIRSRLAQGTIPWTKPWTPGYAGAISRATGRAYGYINQLLLSRNGEYIGLKAAKDAKVDFSGVKTETVVWCSNYERIKKDKDGNPVLDSDGTPKKERVFGYTSHPVLPVALCRGIEEKTPPTGAIHPAFRKDAGVEASIRRFLDENNLSIEENDFATPHYDADKGAIVLPCIGRFKSESSYYAPLFRLLAGVTAGLLDRQYDGKNPDGDQAREELVCEMASMMLLTAFDFDTADAVGDSASYCAKWIDVIGGDNYAVVYGASRAEKAALLILSLDETGMEALPIKDVA